MLVLQVRPEWSDHCSCSLSHGQPGWFIHRALLVPSGDCLRCILSTSIFGEPNTASSGLELSERNVNFTSQPPPCAQSCQEKLMWGDHKASYLISSLISTSKTLWSKETEWYRGVLKSHLALLKEQTVSYYCQEWYWSYLFKMVFSIRVDI